MIFDINDFDETLPGPWEWDVKRLAASFEIMGRDRGFSPDDRRAIVMAGVREYRERMRRAAGMGTLDAWYDQLEAGRAAQAGPPARSASSSWTRRRRGRAEEHVAKARDPRQRPGVRQAGRPRSTASCGSSPTRR